MKTGIKFLTALLLCIRLTANAQSLYPVSLDAKVDHASLIFEGKVVSQQGYWNEEHTMIFTSNKIEVYKVFKGTPEKDTVEISTTGGCVGANCILASHLLKLDADDAGIFFCRPDKQSSKLAAKRHAYEVYSSSQGFLKYDRLRNKAFAPFAGYNSIDRQLYKMLQSKTGRNFTTIHKAQTAKAMDVNQPDAQVSNQVLASSITSFSPAMVTGGTILDPANNILTINGSGFSSTPSGSAAILFDNPDDGSGGNYTAVAYNSPLIVSWTNTQIKVRVPTSSATGFFYFCDNLGTTYSSPSMLTVLFNVLDIDFTYGGVRYIKEARLIDVNGTGGYTIQYSNNTANSGVDVTASAAKGTFQRALNTWKETSGFNVTDGGATTLQQVDPNDGTNIVVFDNNYPGNSHLPDGVLAVCYSGYGICTDNVPANSGYKVGFDVVIRNAGVSTGSTPITFSYGPCSPYTSNVTDVDLETVLLHELGHGINMGHIIDGRQGSTDGQSNPSKVMYFAIDRALRRISEDYSAQMGAAYMITPRSAVLGACGLSEMTPVAKTVEPNDNCPSSFPAVSTPNNTTVNFDLVHATSNRYVDPSYGQLTTTGVGTGITNTAYYALKTNSAGGSLDLSVSGYTTTPGSLASCSIGPPGVPVTGVEVALYQVSSCPTAQSYPTPVFSSTFSSDGLVSIPGLIANTNYLLAFDGVENTKAMFTLGFSGAVLAIQIDEFTGTSTSGINHLRWKANVSASAIALALERSRDGISFNSVTHAGLGGQGTFDDGNPFAGNNYYRLAIKNADGTSQYSRVILLNNAASGGVTVYPNPARGTINIQLDHQESGKYTFIFHNTLGQAVSTRSLTVNGVHDLKQLVVADLPPGLYHLTILKPGGDLLKSVTITLQ